MLGAALPTWAKKIKNLNSTIEYVGTDITEKFVEHNNKNGFNCILSDLEKLPFDDNRFDVTICLDVLNHQLSYEDEIIEMMIN